MYLVAFFAIFTLVSSTIVLELHAISKKDSVNEKLVGVKVGTGYTNDEISSPFIGGADAIKNHRIDKEMVTKVLLRTCSHLYVKALANGCANPREPITVWSFAGTVNNSGSLATAWTGGISPAFSCANIGGYGRKLIQEAIPSSFIISGGYRYDFTGMAGSGRTDPCGYTEIVDLP